MNERTTDEALSNPDLDLLGLAPHAQKLAELISRVPTPFTIGVYGEWGAGKTTFAHFVEHYLLDANRASDAVPVKFIRFEAWPHKTADELWRALIIRIAERLYWPDDPPPKPVEEQAPKTWAQWLASEAILLHEEPKTKNDKEQEQYDELLTRLDATLYGGIGKSGPARWRLDQEQTLAWAVKAGFAALGTASPLIAGIGGLFNSQKDSAGGLQREQNKETRARIESIAAFRKELEDLLKVKGKDEQGQDRRLCIFLDDLDRCAPDVALDLLDAIKVFLSQKQFVFVVAADEEIIGRGLRIRYRELAQADTGTSKGSLTDRLAREGQQYFEKIVQLRIHIPEANPQVAHRFVAAQFPEWMPATDIIFAALGSNPRRVKQYCNWMMFRHSVEKPQLQNLEVQLANESDSVEAHPEADASLLNKLIALYSRSEECLRSLAVLAAGNAYGKTMQLIENHLGKLGKHAGDEAIRQAVADGALHGLCRQISGSEALFDLFLQTPRFSEFNALKVETFAAIADMRPRAGSVLECSDRVFMRILQLSRTASISTQSFVVDEFARLRTVELNSKVLFDRLHELAESSGLEWTAKMLAIEARVQSGKTDFGRSAGPDDDKFDPRMRAVIQALLATEKVGFGVTDRRELLLKLPRLSDIMREVVLAYCTVRKDLPLVADQLLSDRVAKSASEDQKTVTIATHAYGKLAPDARKGVETRIALRKWAAAHCLWMRSFAKLNALDRNWPDFARQLRRDFGALRAIETEVVSPGKLEKQYEPLWAQHRDNDQLRAFLTLQPLFSQIDPMQLQKYLELSQAVSQAAEGAPGTPASGPASAEQSQEAQSEYVNIRLLFKVAEEVDAATSVTDASKAGAKKSGHRPKKKVAPPVARPPNYHIEFQIGDEDPLESDIFLDWGELEQGLEVLRQAALAHLQANGPTRQFSSFLPMGQLVKQLASFGDFPALMRELGRATYENIFSAEMRTRLAELLSKDQRYRFIFECPNEVMSVPFESLYSKQMRAFLALSQRFSLVRWRRPGSDRRRLPLTVPLRVVVVLANPTDSAPLNLEGEEEVLQRVLEPALAAGRVSLEILRRGDATWESVRAVVKSFRPHVFHFVGHGVFAAEGEGQEKRGSIVLENQDHKSVFVGAPEFAALLGDEQIQIAVLNGCDTGTSARNEAISSMADALTNSGVPAVIATMREVADDTALLFTREFYRALCDGQALEIALAEARKALSVERRDWSVYALFASIVQLDVLAIPPATLRRGSELPKERPR